MPENTDYSLENLIKGTEDLIKDVQDLKIDYFRSPQFADNIAHEILEEEFQSMDLPDSPSTDGYAEIVVSEDEMTAKANFFPPAEGRKPIELDDVQALIKDKGIVAGIDWELIKDAVFRCNTERSPISDIIIAHGQHPADEIPPYLVIEESLLKKRSKEAEFSGSVDFREITSFIIVRKGMSLATLVPKKEGVMGASVTGKAIPYGKKEIQYRKPGQNTLWAQGRIIAACDGRFVQDAKSFWVEEILEVAGDVDYHVGNIDFPGDVFIRGEIKDGFKIHSGKSVFCAKSIDASEIDCQKDLITSQGIIGRKEAAIRVGGIIQAKFIENCYVEAKGSIFIQTCVMNSAVHTLDRLELGKKGLIVGGLVYAQNGVTAAQIGTERGPRTEIHCGVDHSVEQKLVWIRDKSVQLAMKLKQVETRIESTPGIEKKEKLTEAKSKLKLAIHRLNEAAKSLIEGLDKNEEAEVTVKGTIFPGTYVEICHVSYLVSKPMTRISLCLDKGKGRIIEKRL